MDTLPKRKPNRYKYHDYTDNGYYHIIICTLQNQKILSTISRCEFETTLDLSSIGKIADEKIIEIEKHYSNIKIINYVIMPNHIHLLIYIDNESSIDKLSVSTVIMSFKRSVSLTVGKSIWQKSFYDHVIKTDEDFQNVYTYIDENPKKWENDDYY